MLKNIIEDIQGIFKSRIVIAGIFFVFLFILLVRRLFDLQIINGEDYLTKFTYRIQKDIELQSPRGTIYDCNGVPLAYNKMSYSVTIEDSTMLSDNQTNNTMVARLLDLIDSTDNTLITTIPIAKNEKGELEYTAGENTILRFKKDVYSTENLTTEQKSASAEELYHYMRGKKMFNLDEKYTIDEALKILSVRFEVYMKRYEKYLSVTVATDVNDELVAAVKENCEDLPGVSISQDYTRVYDDSKYFSNVIGYIGSISEDELQTLKENGDTEYSQNDQIGKTGIEAYCEESLKGVKGSQTLYVNSLGRVLESTESVEPVPGNNIFLSIDADLQKAAYDKLEERIAGILLAYMTDTVDGENKEMMIPIKDFYYALIDNNIINLNDVSSESASEREKSFYKKYQEYESQITQSLNASMKTVMKNLDKEHRSYMTMVFELLKENGFIHVNALDDSDSMLEKWNNNKISFYDFIEYAISKDVIDVSNLNLSENYLDVNEIFDALVLYAGENLSTYKDFEKKVYYYMLQNEVISGREICLLLYDQDILEKDEDYDELLSGELSAYNFMYRKIYYLEITPDMLALPPCSGSYIMTDIKTGKVKALVSYPGYDANKINYVSYFSSLVQNGSSPFYNRVTQQAMAPGSTFKIISAIAGLEEGVITEEDYIYDRVEFTKVEPHAYCWNRGGHGSVNVVDAIMYSCNYFFYSLGYKMGMTPEGLSDTKGLEILRKYATMFGLNETTGIELQETEPKISDTTVVRSAIGQGTNNYTAAQLARYITAVANSGNLYKLSVLDKISDSNGTITKEIDPVLSSKIDISQKTWDLVHEGMYKVCNESSYKEKMGRLDVTIAGKSGTAQESEALPNHGLFVGYAPYENPEVAAVLIIPNGHGSSNVLDLYADLMCYYYNTVNPNTLDEEDDSSVRHANIPEHSVAAD